MICFVRCYATFIMLQLFQNVAVNNSIASNHVTFSVFNEHRNLLLTENLSVTHFPPDLMSERSRGQMVKDKVSSAKPSEVRVHR